MATKKLRAVHAGDILQHDFMEPLGLSAHELAKDLGMTALAVNEVLRRRRVVTAETALRLFRYFGTTEQLWQNQVVVSLSKLMKLMAVPLISLI
jgi:addiction module HigA family antidote